MRGTHTHTHTHTHIYIYETRELPAVVNRGWRDLRENLLRKDPVLLLFDAPFYPHKTEAKEEWNSVSKGGISCWTGKETKELHSSFFDTKRGKEKICCPNKIQQPFKRKEGLKELYFRASSSYNPRETRWSNKRIPCCNKTEKKEEKEGELPRERERD
jgi:hypothetical protein